MSSLSLLEVNAGTVCSILLFWPCTMICYDLLKIICPLDWFKFDLSIKDIPVNSLIISDLKLFIVCFKISLNE